MARMVESDHAIARATAPWAGRTAELALLGSCWDKTRAGRAQLVLLTGALGSGRTALAERFCDQVGSNGDILQICCPPVAEPPVLDVVSTLIRALMGCAPDASEATVRDGLDRLASPFEEPEAMLALLGHLMGIATSHPAVRLLDPASLQQAAFAALGDVLLARSDAHPQLLVLDNLHWADPGSRTWFIDLAMRLSMATDAQHMMILATGTTESGNPEAAAGTIETLNGGGLDATLIELPPLSVIELQAIATDFVQQNLSQLSEPAHQLADAAVARALGNPAHLLETLRVYLEQGGLRRSALGWEVRADLAAFRSGRPLPSDIEEAIATRLATLPGKVLEAKARRESPAQEYRHAVQSAERAAVVSVPEEAARLFGQALTWADKVADWSDKTLPDRDTVRMGLALAHIRLGRSDEALADLAQLETVGGPKSEIHHARGTALERRGEVNEAFEAYTRALELARRDNLAKARAKSALADMRRRMGRFTDAILLAEEAKRLFEELDQPLELARVHGVLGICYIRCEEPGNAMAELDAALGLRERIGDLEGIANTHNSLGILEVSLDKLAEAEADYEKALGLFRKLASPRGAAMTLNNLSDLALKRDDLVRATGYLMEAQRLARQLGQSTEFVTTTGNLAEIFLKRGNPREALKLCDACLSLALRVGQTEWLSELHDLKGRALAKGGDVSAARHEFRLALDAAERAGNAAFAEKMRDRLERER